MSTNYFALVDCNSFYCSCERVFQPQLAHKPVVVLSNNDGCIVSRTEEAKALGIGMASPYHQIKDFCKKNRVAVFSSNYALYGDMSRRVMSTLQDFTPQLEVYSIDEAFLTLSANSKDDLQQLAEKIRNTVFRNTGLPVGVGVAPTKALAKLANHLAKKNKNQGIHMLYDDQNLDEQLSTVGVEDIWGIGRQSASKLQQYDIISALDFKNADPHFIQKLLTISGRKIQDEFRGQSCIELDDMQTKKNILSSRSFGKKVTSIEDLKEAASYHATLVAEKLRTQSSIAGSITLFIRTNRFSHKPQYYNSSTIPLFSGTASTPKIIKHALILLEQIYRKDFEYQKLGIILSDLEKKDSAQMDLFLSNDTSRDDYLMKTIDKINAKNGKATIQFASTGIKKTWQMRQALKSKRYTTSWDELLEVE